MNGRKKVAVGQGAQLKKLVVKALIAVAAGGIMLITSTALTYVMSSIQSDQLEVVMALEQYRTGSKTLTSEVQSYAVTGKQIYYDGYMKELNEDMNRDKAIATLEQHDVTEDEWAHFDEISALSNSLVPLEEAALDSVAAGDLTAAQESVFGDDYENTIIEITNLMDDVITQIQQRKADQKNMVQLIQLITQVVFVLSLVYVVWCLVKTIQFARTELLIPIKKAAEQMGHLAQGDFSKTLDLQEDESEVGQMVSSIRFMKENVQSMISEIAEALGKMADGDYQFRLEKEYVGEFIQIKESIKKIREAMRETLNTLRDVSEQINSGSEQLACAAQDLAEGSTTQATQVTEVAEAIKKMAVDISQNAVAAEESVKIASGAGEALMEGNQKMQALKEAIGEISKCSEEIGGIIGAIDDIASQTNLLSLNAAIEAARAGEAGKGFAVVADQVKNLAEESAKAAGKTTELIQTTIDAVNRGIDMADATVSSMVEVIAGAQEATEKMGAIAKTLDESAEHMNVINETVASVSAVVDNNSATSEETAAVSEEQKAQVETMVSMMNNFKI